MYTDRYAINRRAAARGQLRKAQAKAKLYNALAAALTFATALLLPVAVALWALAKPESLGATAALFFYGAAAVAGLGMVASATAARFWERLGQR